ncbi:MAG: hypothetical protein ACRDUY_08155 [Nitriliruptorales bacterium]
MSDLAARFTHHPPTTEDLSMDDYLPDLIAETLELNGATRVKAEGDTVIAQYGATGLFRITVERL